MSRLASRLARLEKASGGAGAVPVTSLYTVFDPEPDVEPRLFYAKVGSTDGRDAIEITRAEDECEKDFLKRVDAAEPIR